MSVASNEESELDDTTVIEERLRSFLSPSKRKANKSNIFSDFQGHLEVPRFRRSIIVRALEEFVSSTPAIQKTTGKFFYSEASYNISPVTNSPDVPQNYYEQTLHFENAAQNRKNRFIQIGKKRVEETVDVNKKQIKLARKSNILNKGTSGKNRKNIFDAENETVPLIRLGSSLGTFDEQNNNYCNAVCSDDNNNKKGPVKELANPNCLTTGKDDSVLSINASSNIFNNNNSSETNVNVETLPIFNSSGVATRSRSKHIQRSFNCNNSGPLEDNALYGKISVKTIESLSENNETNNEVQRNEKPVNQGSSPSCTNAISSRDHEQVNNSVEKESRNNTVIDLYDVADQHGKVSSSNVTKDKSKTIDKNESSSELSRSEEAFKTNNSQSAKKANGTNKIANSVKVAADNGSKTIKDNLASLMSSNNVNFVPPKASKSKEKRKRNDNVQPITQTNEYPGLRRSTRERKPPYRRIIGVIVTYSERVYRCFNLSSSQKPDLLSELCLFDVKPLSKPRRNRNIAAIKNKTEKREQTKNSDYKRKLRSSH